MSDFNVDYNGKSIKVYNIGNNMFAAFLESKTEEFPEIRMISREMDSWTLIQRGTNKDDIYKVALYDDGSVSYYTLADRDNEIKADRKARMNLRDDSTIDSFLRTIYEFEAAVFVDRFLHTTPQKIIDIRNDFMKSALAVLGYERPEDAIVGKRKDVGFSNLRKMVQQLMQYKAIDVVRIGKVERDEDVARVSQPTESSGTFFTIRNSDGSLPAYFRDSKNKNVGERCEQDGQNILDDFDSKLNRVEVMTKDNDALVKRRNETTEGARSFNIDCFGDMQHKEAKVNAEVCNSVARHIALLHLSINGNLEVRSVSQRANNFAGVDGTQLITPEVIQKIKPQYEKAFKAEEEFAVSELEKAMQIVNQSGPPENMVGTVTAFLKMLEDFRDDIQADRNKSPFNLKTIKENGELVP